MISFYFHPNYSGSAIQALNLSRHLVDLGAKPMIVSANLSGSPAHDSIDGIPLYRLPTARQRDLQVPTFSAALLRFLVAHRQKYDVIHAHGVLQHVTASLAGRWLGKPTILKVAMADSCLAFHRHGRVRGRVNRTLVRQFDTYIATTTAIVDECSARGLDASRVRLIPNGVDTDVFTPLSPERRRALRASLGLPDGPLVTYVGIMNPRKNIDGILRIWQAVSQRHPDAHLALIGPRPPDSDPFFTQLVAFMKTAGLTDRVTFTGFREPVVPYLQAADAFLFPSRQEGMANSVLEAMSCGVPCLVSDAAGVASVIRDGVNGYALDVNDEGGFVAALLELLNNPRCREQLGAEARQTVVSRFSLASTAARYRDLYAELLQTRRAQS
jgi:glycosyltransferase involved in cell wall biosynthesis